MKNLVLVLFVLFLGTQFVNAQNLDIPTPTTLTKKEAKEEYKDLMKYFEEKQEVTVEINELLEIIDRCQKFGVYCSETVNERWTRSHGYIFIDVSLDFLFDQMAKSGIDVP